MSQQDVSQGTGTWATQPPKLLDQLQAQLRLKHYSKRTEEAYMMWARRYILFHQKRHPKDMGLSELE